MTDPRPRPGSLQIRLPNGTLLRETEGVADRVPAPSTPAQLLRRAMLAEFPFTGRFTTTQLLDEALETARAEGRREAVREIREQGHAESGTYDTAVDSERAIEIGDFDRILDRVAGLNATESPPTHEPRRIWGGPSYRCTGCDWIGNDWGTHPRVGDAHRPPNMELLDEIREAVLLSAAHLDLFQREPSHEKLRAIVDNISFFHLQDIEAAAGDCRDGHDFRLTTDFDGEPIRCRRCKCLPEAP